MSSKALTHRKVQRINLLPISTKKLTPDQPDLTKFYPPDFSEKIIFKNLADKSKTLLLNLEHQKPEPFYNSIVNTGPLSPSNSLSRSLTREKSLSEALEITSFNEKDLLKTENFTCSNLFCQHLFSNNERYFHLIQDYVTQIRVLTKKTEKDITLYKIELQEKYQKLNQKFRSDQMKIFEEKINLFRNENRSENDDLRRDKKVLERKLGQSLDQISKIREDMLAQFAVDLKQELLEKEKEMNLVKFEELKAQKAELNEMQKAQREQLKATFNRELHNLQQEYSSKLEKFQSLETSEIGTQTDEKEKEPKTKVANKTGTVGSKKPTRPKKKSNSNLSNKLAQLKADSEQEAAANKKLILKHENTISRMIHENAYLRDRLNYLCKENSDLKFEMGRF